MGIAAVVFLCLAEHARLDTILVPSVGVREGILCDLAAQHFGAPGLDERRARTLIDLSKNIATRFHCDIRHAEYVRAIAALLFDQLAAKYGLPPELRLPLEMAAILHNSGRAVRAKKATTNTASIWCRIRSCRGCPTKRKRFWRAWCATTVNPNRSRTINYILRRPPPRDRRRIREAISGILRIAVAMGAGGTQNVRALRVRASRKQLRLRLFLGARRERGSGNDAA